MGNEFLKVVKKKVSIWRSRAIDLGLSQKDIAYAVGVTPGHLSKVIRGVESTSLTLYCKTEDFLAKAESKFSQLT